MSVGAVSATGTFTSNCTYLRRGQYGTSPSSHSSGDQFTIIDVLGVSGTSVIYTLPPLYIGQKIYFKLASFNQFHTSEQSLAACTEYSYIPTGLGYGTATDGVPSTPTGLAVLSILGAATLSWNANPVIDNVNEYLVYRANGSGASFGSATLITEVSALTWTDTTTAAASYTYFLVAQNNAGESGPTAGVNVTVAAFQVPVVTSSLGSISSPVEGDLAFLTTDGQLYRYHSGAWTVDVPAVNITGTIVNAQVANGAIDANNLGPGSVTASKLFVGGVGAALNTDPGTSDLSAWTAESPTYNVFGITSVAGGPVGNTALYSATSGSPITAWAINTQTIPVDLTKTYRVRCWWNTFSGCNGGFYLGVKCLDYTGANLGDEWFAGNDLAPVTSWTEAIAVFGAGTSNSFPTGTVNMQVEIVLNWGGTAGYMEAQDIRIEEVLPSTLIQDGSIVTSKIAADAVTATNIAANAVTAGTIAANAVTAGTIASNAVVAGTIAAGAIDVGTEIVNNLIVTGHIQNGAVTAQLQLNASSVLLPSSGASTTMLTGTLTTSGNSAITLISARFNNDAYFEFDIDGVAQWNGSTAGVYQLDSQGYPGAQLFTPLSAGSHTFLFWGNDLSGSGTTVINIQMIVMEWQR